MNIADRILNMEESATLAMTQKGRELAQKGHDVISLSIGEPDFNTPEFIKKAAIKAMDDNFTHYSPVPGYMDLREAVCLKLKRDNNLDFKPENIVISTGAKQALANVILSVINPGDEVIVPAPFWVSYSEMIKLAEGVPVYVPTSVETNFKATAEQIEAVISPKTKMIMFNSPNNPSGSIYQYEEVASIAKMLAKYPDILVVSDEIYELINFSGDHVSFGSFPEISDRVVIINGVSKGFAMTGWRIGYLAAPVAIAKATNKFQGQITSGTNSIAQKAAVAALEKSPKEVVELQEMVAAFKKRRNLLHDLMLEIPNFKVNMPEGAFYLFPEVKSYYGKKCGERVIKNDTDLCMYILETAFVSLVPGGAFGNPDCIRFSYATSEDRLIEAMKRIKKVLAELK